MNDRKCYPSLKGAMCKRWPQFYFKPFKNARRLSTECEERTVLTAVLYYHFVPPSFLIKKWIYVL